MALPAPRDADAEAALADFKAGRYLEASAEIQAVRRSNARRTTTAISCSGTACSRCAALPKLSSQFRRALSLNPTRAEYYHGFALALNASGQLAADDPRGDRRSSLAPPTPRTRSALLALRAYAWGSLQTVERRGPRSRGGAAYRVRSRGFSEFLGKAQFASGAYAEAIPPLRQVAARSTRTIRVVLRLLAECSIRLAAAERDPIREAVAVRNVAELRAAARVGEPRRPRRACTSSGAPRWARAVSPRPKTSSVTSSRTTRGSATRWPTWAGRTWPQRAGPRRRPTSASASACAPRLTTVYESLGELYSAARQAAGGRRRVPSRRGDRADAEPAAEPTATIPVFQPR